MTTQVQAILESFERLGEEDQRELVSELLRRGAGGDVPPLSDEQLVSIAEEVFLQLDHEEACDA